MTTESQLEIAITGHEWKDCSVCRSVRIPVSWNPPWCSKCGGPVVNCVHCQTGRRWWVGSMPPYSCPVCYRDPLVPQPVIKQEREAIASALSACISGDGVEDFLRQIIDPGKGGRFTVTKS